MGATFTVRLPLMLNITQKDENTVKQHNYLNLEGLHILVVDDEIDTRDFLSIMLKQFGAMVSVVASAGEALEFIAKSQIDLLLSDIGMPGIDGYMLMHLIRAMPPEQGGQIPAIALTAYAGEMNQKQALSAGYQLHLVKPVEPDVLLKAITQVLAQPSLN